MCARALLNGGSRARCRARIRSIAKGRHGRDDGAVIDPGIEIYVRNKPRRYDHVPARPHCALCAWRDLPGVHGIRFAARLIAWMDYIAARGYDVYLLDLRGYGKSTRPKEMSQPPEANGPIVRGDTAVKDIGSAVEFSSAATSPNSICSDGRGAPR